jgi:dTDP-4-dehydrorhamnose reductase
VKILLFGGAGQLGYEIRTRAADLEFEVVSPVVTEVDITDHEQVLKVTRSSRPDVVINCAAYTAVDKAEEEVEQAFRINRDGAATIAEACAETSTRCIHVSTDYVFDGSLGRPLREDDPTNPLSVYGRSKWEGEERIRAVLGDDALIVRTQALYGLKGVNFVYTMLKLFGEREVVKVVDDQWVSPTWAGWLGEVLLDCARIKVGGTLHASCEGTVSWYDFASEIRRLSLPHFGDKPVAVVERTTAAKLSRPAVRPTFSAFDTSRITAVLGRPPMRWNEALEAFLQEIHTLEGPTR